MTKVQLQLTKTVLQLKWYVTCKSLKTTALCFSVLLCSLQSHQVAVFLFQNEFTNI